MKNVPEIIFGWCFTFDAGYSSNVGFMYIIVSMPISGR